MSDGPGRGDGGFPPPPGGSTPADGGSQEYPGGGGPGGWGGQDQPRRGGEQPSGGRERQPSGWGGAREQQPGWGGAREQQPGWGGPGEQQPGWGGAGEGQQGWGDGGQQPGWGGPGYGGPPQGRNSAALASMICGLISLGCLFLFFLLITIPVAVATALAAVIAGVFGLRAAGRLGTGRGQAITGLVTGTISLLLVGFVTFAAIFTWTQMGFETNPFTDPEGFFEEMERRGFVDEEGQIDQRELERELEDEPLGDGQF